MSKETDQIWRKQLELSQFVARCHTGILSAEEQAALDVQRASSTSNRDIHYIKRAYFSLHPDDVFHSLRRRIVLEKHTYGGKCIQ